MSRWNPGESLFVGGSLLGGGGIAAAIAQPARAPAAASDEAPLGPVTPEWRRWIAENLLMDRDPQTIVDAMVRDGLDGNAAVHEVRLAMQHPYLLAARQITAGVAPGVIAAAQAAGAQAMAGQGGDPTPKVKKRDWVLECQRRAARQATTYGSVPRVRRPNRAEFLDRFYSQNKPVVIEGAMDDWPAMTRWTDADYLKSKCGDRVVEVQANRNSDANYELNQTKLKQEMTFAQFVDLTETAGQTNNWYITANNSGKNKEALKELWDDIVVFPDYLRDDDPANRGFFWFGPAGTVTPLHHDLTNNFMAQVRGRKLVRLIAPHDLPYLYNNRHCYSPVNLDAVDHAKYPLFRNARVIDVTIGPGDLLFLPVGWWHYVRGLDISITMTFTNFVYDNDFYSFYETYQDI
jgi:hypothetical protein